MTTQVINGTIEDDIVNSTSADESFTMGTGTNIINFDLSNNNRFGTDEIHLTPGEDLTLNFYALTSNQIKWERVVDTDTNNIDIQIKTYAYYTYGYSKIVLTASDEVSYVNSEGVTYYKTLATFYLYDYENDEWVENKTSLDNYYPTNSPDYHVEYYGQCRVGTDGLIEYTWNNDNGTDNHAAYAAQNGMITSSLDTLHPNNVITIKNIGAENPANSVKLQYQYKSGDYTGSSQTIVENFLTQTYTVGLNSWQETTTEDQILQGSFLNETFRAGYGNDNINTVGGTNTVNLYNGGKDVITLGVGADTVNATFAQGQAQGNYEDLGYNTVATGGAYIYGGTSDDKLLLDEGSHYFYRDDSDNLIIIQNYQYGSFRNSKITVDDYFISENKINIITNNYYNESCQVSNGDAIFYNNYIYTNKNGYFLDKEGNVYIRTFGYNNTE